MFFDCIYPFLWPLPEDFILLTFRVKKKLYFYFFELKKRSFFLSCPGVSFLREFRTNTDRDENLPSTLKKWIYLTLRISSMLLQPKYRYLWYLLILPNAFTNSLGVMVSTTPSVHVEWSHWLSEGCWVVTSVKRSSRDGFHMSHLPTK